MRKNTGCLSLLAGIIAIAVFFIFTMSVPPSVFLIIFFGLYFLLILTGIRKKPKESKPETELREPEVEKDSGKTKLDELKSELSDLRDVIKAFRVLGLSMDASYTKVNQTYYKLVQKIQKSKMPEEERQKKLKELEDAYNILQEYYSKKY